MITELEKNTILIVDDEPIIRRSLRYNLQKAGYPCLEAENAQGALEQLKSQTIALAILDIKMPGMSGKELLSEIKKLYRNTAVVMSTSIIDHVTIVECMKDGAQDYIVKPFDQNDVLMRVERILRFREMEQRLESYHNNLEIKVNEQTKNLRRLFLAAVESLVNALESKDIYTAGHSHRTANIAANIGRELKLSEKEMETLHWGALLHDVGKISIDVGIQNKPSKLTPEEYKHVMTHANISANIVEPLVDKETVEVIRHHHDRYDGTGLGQIAVGQDIPLVARIIALADSVDAMMSDRPYRGAMPLEQVLTEINRCAGTQFDPQVIEAFVRLETKKLVAVS
jgi:putative nucleotidyltransferase with HDIG domain